MHLSLVPGKNETTSLTGFGKHSWRGQYCWFGLRCMLSEEGTIRMCAFVWEAKDESVIKWHVVDQYQASVPLMCFPPYGEVYELRKEAEKELGLGALTVLLRPPRLPGVPGQGPWRS